MKQQKFFIISIIIIAIISAIFYGIRYNSITIDIFSRYPNLILNGTFSDFIDPKRIEKMIPDFPIDNNSLKSVTNLTSFTNEIKSNSNAITGTGNVTDDTNLINTLTKIIISKFNTTSSNRLLPSSSDFVNMKLHKYNATGTWNASIVHGEEFNFSAQIKLEKINEGIRPLRINLESSAPDKVTIIQGRNESILVNGIGEVKLGNNKFRSPILFIFSNMKDIYIYLPTSLRDVSNPDISLIGKIDTDNQKKIH